MLTCKDKRLRDFVTVGPIFENLFQKMRKALEKGVGLITFQREILFRYEINRKM